MTCFSEGSCLFAGLEQYSEIVTRYAVRWPTIDTRRSTCMSVSPSLSRINHASLMSEIWGCRR
jgi:hypothetical protein